MGLQSCYIQYYINENGKSFALFQKKIAATFNAICDLLYLSRLIKSYFSIDHVV
jgi:hypothetical protein